jgi:hypothetical protein
MTSLILYNRDLYDNAITKVDVGAFSGLTSLFNLFVLMRSFDLGWLSVSL